MMLPTAPTRIREASGIYPPQDLGSLPEPVRQRIPADHQHAAVFTTPPRPEPSSRAAQAITRVRRLPRHVRCRCTVAARAPKVRAEHGQTSPIHSRRSSFGDARSSVSGSAVRRNSTIRAQGSAAQRGSSGRHRRQEPDGEVPVCRRQRRDRVMRPRQDVYHRTPAATSLTSVTTPVVWQARRPDFSPRCQQRLPGDIRVPSRGIVVLAADRRQVVEVSDQCDDGKQFFSRLSLRSCSGAAARVSQTLEP